MNSFNVTGRLTTDCVVKITQNGNQVINFTIANNTGYGKKKETNFFDCEYWTKAQIGAYLLKGKAVEVSGEIIQDKWVDKQGQNQSRYKINIQNNGLQFSQGEPKQQNQTTPQQNTMQNNTNNINQQFNQQPDSWETASGDIPF